MKSTLIRVCVLLALSMTFLAQSATNENVSTRRSKISQIGVSFGKPMPQHIPAQKWIGKRLSEVLPVLDIAKLILMKADTQATGDIDLLSIYGTLTRESVFYESDNRKRTMYSTYEAVILTQDQKVYFLQIGADQDGHGVARLTSETGEYGYFR